MIRHVVFFSAKDPADLGRIEEGLWGLAAIEHARNFEVARNLQADQPTGSAVEVVVYAEFADRAALEAYKAHPIYQETIDVVRPLRELRLAADFVAAERP